jgi:hypothetical protein
LTLKAFKPFDRLSWFSKTVRAHIAHSHYEGDCRNRSTNMRHFEKLFVGRIRSCRVYCKPPTNRKLSLIYFFQTLIYSGFSELTVEKLKKIQFLTRQPPATYQWTGKNWNYNIAFLCQIKIIETITNPIHVLGSRFRYLFVCFLELPPV